MDSGGRSEASAAVGGRERENLEEFYEDFLERTERQVLNQDSTLLRWGKDHKGQMLRAVGLSIRKQCPTGERP